MTTEPTPPVPDHSQKTTEAAIIEDPNDASVPESSEASIKNPQTSGVTSSSEEQQGQEEHEKTVKYADELLEQGNLAFKDNDFPEAADLFSRSLEIRVAHYGELAPECIHLYYKYGFALLNKAQEESDPLGSMPKKEAVSRQDSVKVEDLKNNAEAESSLASVSSNVEQCESSNQQQGSDDGPDKSNDDKGDESDVDEEVDEADEDESDLDLAWKMLDLGRAISEKHSLETIDLVEILSALAEVSLEREEIETALSDYQKALSILERLVEPDSRHICELNFRICLTLEVGSRAQEAVPYCQRAISVCKSRIRRLTDELKSLSKSASSTSTSECENDVSRIQAEIESLNHLASDLEKKLEDLQLLESNPKSILSDILGLAAAKASANEQAGASAAASSSRIGAANNNSDFDSPTVSTAHTNGNAGVTHLGVVGRGVKRVIMNSGDVDSSASKKPAVNHSHDAGDSSGP